MGHKFHLERAARLHAPERDRRQPWRPALEVLDLRGVRVALDLGCGTGYFALPLARALGPDARVLALDVEPGMLALLRARAAEAGVSNVRPVLTGEPGLPLRTAAADLVLLVNMLHEFDDLHASLVEVARVLRPGGRLFLSDWRKIATEEGPPLEARIDEAEAAAAVARAGFVAVTGLPLYREHYALLAARPH